jgi:hypothetical protein
VKKRHCIALHYVQRVSENSRVAGIVESVILQATSGRLIEQTVTIRRDWESERESVREIEEEEERSIEKGSCNSAEFPRRSLLQELQRNCVLLSQDINRKHSSRGRSFPPGSEPRKYRVVSLYSCDCCLLSAYLSCYMNVCFSYEFMHAIFQFSSYMMRKVNDMYLS